MSHFRILCAKNTAEVWLYGNIGGGMWGDGVSAKDFADELGKHENLSDIVVRINSSGGDAPVKSAYSGTASCFDIQLSGSSGGQAVRIGFTQTSDTAGRVSPFSQIAPVSGGGYSGRVCTNDVSCPDWSISAGTCAITGQQYDLQIQVVGGEGSGTVDLCLVSVIPS